MIQRRLIEEELPLEKVNTASGREKTLRHGHISTLHLWWARRPLSMSRTIVAGTLLPDPGDADRRQEMLDTIARAAPFEASTESALIEPLRKLIHEAYPEAPPKVLDCFAGGGAIPLEALRLGCDVTAVDLNPVAHLLLRCVLEYPQEHGQSSTTGGNSLADDFVRWAGWVRARVEPNLAKVFPGSSASPRPSVYFWARTMVCANPTCRTEVPLLSSFWLAKSSRRRVWLDVKLERGRIGLNIRSDEPSAELDLDVGTIRSSSVTCPCGHTMPAKDVRAYGKEIGFGRRLYAVLDIDGRERTYRNARIDEFEAAECASARLEYFEDLPDGTPAIPDEKMVKSQYRRYVNLVYGIDTFRGLFNDRQLYVLLNLSEAVRAAHAEMLNQGLSESRAKALTTYLGLCVDRIADYNSSFAAWHLSRELIRNTFPQQAIRMAWDYTEIDPLSKASGSWDGAVRWIELVIRHCSTTGSDAATVHRGNAQQLLYPDASFDVVIVDPPYYDAFQYGDLSDFFYIWLKRTVGFLYPELFATPLTPKTQEIIESRADKKSPEYISHKEFEGRLQRALCEMARVVKQDGLVAIVFAHTDVEAWERLLRGLRTAGLVVSTSWPMRSEMASRPTAQISAVLNSSVVLICRPQHAREEAFYDDVVRDLEARIAERLDAFEAMGMSGADYFVSAVGPAFDVFARYARIVRLSGEEVDVSDLMVLARQVVARHAMRRLLGGESLAALDDESLFYLTWRWAYLTASLPADEAYKLERAFDVDLEAMTRPGGLNRRSGSSFQLLGPQDRGGIKLSASPPLVDVLHLACQLWDAGRRRELEDLLGATRMGNEPGFWAMGRLLGEVLPDGNRERTMLLGLTGNRDVLAQAAARSTTSAEELRLFDVGSE